MAIGESMKLHRGKAQGVRDQDTATSHLSGLPASSER